MNRGKNMARKLMMIIIIIILIAIILQFSTSLKYAVEKVQQRAKPEYW